MPRFERDVKKAKRGKEVIYANVLGLKSDLSGPSDHVELGNAALSEALKQKHSEASPAGKNRKHSTGDDDGTEEDSETDSDSEDEDGTKFKNAHRPKNETAEERKVWQPFMFETQMA